jgi:hypothetical protein
MPRGPKGEKRPADVIGNAVRVMQIATGEAEEEYEAPPSKKAQAGQLGGKARLAKLAPAERVELAKKGADARWGKPKRD